MPLKVRTKAPDFTLKTKDPEGLKDVTLYRNLGRKNTILLFFPGAYTVPCTKELCEITRLREEGLHRFADADVLAVSVDSPYVQEAWAKENNITITLLSDYKREVIKLYDVVLPDLVGLGPSSARAAYVIDKEGYIQYSEQTPAPEVLPNFVSLRRALTALY